jgi:hypothetical protein
VPWEDDDSGGGGGVGQVAATGDSSGNIETAPFGSNFSLLPSTDHFLHKKYIYSSITPRRL